METICDGWQNLPLKALDRTQTAMEHQQRFAVIGIFNAPGLVTTEVEIRHHYTYFSERRLERVEDVAVTAIKGEVVPGPVRDGADLVTSTK